MVGHGSGPVARAVVDKVLASTINRITI